MDVSALRVSLDQMHANLGSWREVGEVIGKSGAYAMRVANGTLDPSDEVVARWCAYRPAKPRTRKRYHRPCMDDQTYTEWLQWKESRR